jgi:hypothetical protein
MIASSPWSIAARNGARSRRQSVAAEAALTGSVRCASPGDVPCPGKRFATATTPALPALDKRFAERRHERGVFEQAPPVKGDILAATNVEHRREIERKPGVSQRRRRRGDRARYA